MNSAVPLPRSGPFGNGKALSSGWTAAGAFWRVASDGTYVFATCGWRTLKPFVGAEEEQLVLLNRPAQHAAEIVLPQFGPRQTVGVCEPVVGIQLIVAEVLEGSPVKRVRAGLGDHRYLSAGSAPIFRRKGGSLNSELFQRIERNQVAGPSKCAGCRKLAGPALVQEIAISRGAKICTHSIHHEVVRIRPLAIDAELALLRMYWMGSTRLPAIDR